MIRSLILSLVVLGACAAPVRYVAGTRIPYSDNNKTVLDAAEQYRLAVERGDVDALMLMADHAYWEDSGTPTGADDYGFEGLRNVLLTRYRAATDIRYSIRYVAVHQACPKDLRPGCRAEVEILIDASYSIENALGKSTRLDKRDQNELVFDWDGHRWLILSGM
jgi:hypothetical protein